MAWRSIRWTALHAPADGTVVSLHAAGHAITLRLDGGVEVLMHIGSERCAWAVKVSWPMSAPGIA
jgi:phosphotransferase system IIA component